MSASDPPLPAAVAGAVRGRVPRPPRGAPPTMRRPARHRPGGLERERISRSARPERQNGPRRRAPDDTVVAFRRLGTRRFGGVSWLLRIVVRHVRGCDRLRRRWTASRRSSALPLLLLAAFLLTGGLIGHLIVLPASRRAAGSARSRRSVPPAVVGRAVERLVRPPGTRLARGLRRRLDRGDPLVRRGDVRCRRRHRGDRRPRACHGRAGQSRHGRALRDAPRDHRCRDTHLVGRWRVAHPGPPGRPGGMTRERPPRRHEASRG